MTALLDRVQRLREETADSWLVIGETVCAPVEGCTCGAEHETFPHEPYCGIEPLMRVPSEPDRTHIARWDPAAAEKTLDLLAWLAHEHQTANSECGTCGEPWPCETAHLAAAVLDALDGGEASDAPAD